MSSLKNVNLEVARYAMECVKDAIKEEELKSTEYKTLVKKMNFLVQKNGLIGTLVFIFSKANKAKHHEKVLEQTRDWCYQSSKLQHLKKLLAVKEQAAMGDKEVKVDEFIVKITELDPINYRLVTKEIMLLFGWVKRFADGMIEGQDGDNGE